ncbi:MAG: dockerin type I repeat-containing protein [Fimbriimonadales bacterium]|nr:dockerin type I repeat-containing protein [Fimbriimonadales bacterium]
MRVRASLLGLLSVVAVSVSAAQVAQQLARGGDFVFKFNGADYRITGAANFQESFNPRDPIRLDFSDLNNDTVALDVLLDLRPFANINRQVPLLAQVLSDGSNEAVIRWRGTDNPNICVEVSDDGFSANILIFEVTGVLTGRVRRVPCAPDPYNTLGRNTHLEIVKEGGDAENNLRVRAYLFCLQNPFTIITVDVFNIRWAGSGGGLPRRLGNVNGDCVINDSDLLQILLGFGTNNAAADVNGDGIVNDSDLLITLLNFGQSV